MDLLKTMMLYMVLVLSGASVTDAELPKELPVVSASVAETAAPTEAAVPTDTPAPVPTAVPAANKPYETLRSGSRGESVTQLQQRLKDLGYSINALDGVYGKKTKAAVEAFQKDHGLTADGIAGPQTQAVLEALFSEFAETLTEAGQTVRVDGRALTIPWYADESGCLWVGLAAFAEQDGWETVNGAYRTRSAGVSVACAWSADSCVLTIDGAEASDCAMVWNGAVYVNTAFFERLGATVTTEGETLAMFFNG